MVNNVAKKSITSAFFLGTLLIWCVSVAFEIHFNKRFELIVIFFGFIFFQFANFFIRKGGSNDPLFVNTCVSLLHSSTISCSVVLILENELRRTGIIKMFEHSNLVEGTWKWGYQIVAFSCGYFAYDQLDMLVYGLYSGWFPSILLHHLVLLICFTLALYRNITINYLVLTLFCELHSVFLHVRKVRRMCGIRYSGSKIVKVEWILNWMTFTFARLLSHILITLKLIRDSQNFEKSVDVLPLALFGMAGMNLLNIFLGINLLHAHKREKIRGSRNHHLE